MLKGITKVSKNPLPAAELVMESKPKTIIPMHYRDESNTYDIMSVSEWEQAKPAHHERRMAIMNEIHDIMSVSEWEQVLKMYLYGG